MLKKLIALSVVFGLIVAEPAAKLTAPSYDDLGNIPTYIDVIKKRTDIGENKFDVLAKPDVISLVFDLITAVVGFKASAITVTVAAIKWLVSNGVLIAIGAIVTLGFCKLTGKCHLVEQVVPVAELRSLVTPERLDSAQELLFKAVKRYAQDTKSQN